ncbi:putative wac domain-containing protein [Phaeoacremonium minimum UCRPA7]|uniref:Putative wac domain-containing protein n=1 Tax=Phaeoacremonium minimum (strain UCR-PA7) TaxID=1286976 RepID=R8BUH0_PHAM7|nr:putative wac domain-containing protein [Phaeoacremonium minimum UCRPA7]EOO03033.1 putative wac domain-containing protein [Phaeoacremonium minimum UCRPA7]
MAIIIPPTPNSYLTRDEYTILRHSQDNHLTREFAGLHHSIDGIKRELKEFKEDVKLQFTAVDQRFNAVDQRLDIVQLQLNENTAEIRQSAAYSRNSSIKNPYQRITPLVAYRPAHGLADPDLDFFPKTADEFYKLRSPITSAQRKMLHYLINFYDLTNDPSILPVDRSVDDGDIDPSPFPYDPVRAVESIEVVLGLDEEKIIAFKQRAQQYAAQTLHLPSKRPNIASNNELEHLARRPKFDPTSPTSRHPDSSRIGRPLNPVFPEAKDPRL